MTPWDK